MKKRGKKYTEALSKIENGKVYSKEEAINLSNLHGYKYLNVMF